ncbi:PHD finger protein-like protein [Drosera capensis]
MKSSNRSHRLPSTDPPDDWVDGSWTVDCICGVNFDDGEEMVSCDDCGVWVHTRCSRFVKGDTSYACDKCKVKASRTNDSDLTEVAQLLAELPTKTVKIKSSGDGGGTGTLYGFKGPPPRDSPYKVRAARPYEERVHVQGIPGGDPKLFQGLSPIFTAQLWKSTGYVPKKFTTLRYREFPCWEPQKPDGVPVPEIEDGDDKGAGVLYSLSKDAAVAAAVLGPSVGPRTQRENSHSNEKSSKDKKSKPRDTGCKETPTVLNKDRDLVRPFMLHSGKRKREDIGPSKDRTRRKKSKATMKEFDSKSDRELGAKSASDHANYYGDSHGKEPKLLTLGITDCIDEQGRDTGSDEDASEVNMDLDSQINMTKSYVASLEIVSEAVSSEISGLNYSVDVVALSKDKVHTDCSNAVGSSPVANVVPPLLFVQDDASVTLLENKGKPVDDRCIKGASERQTTGVHRSESCAEEIANSSLEVKDNELLEENYTPLVKALRLDIKTEGDIGGDASVGALTGNLDDIDVKSGDAVDLAQHALPCPHTTENYEEYTAFSNRHKKQEVAISEAGIDCSVAKENEVCLEGLPVEKAVNEQNCHAAKPKIMIESKNSTASVEWTCTSGGPILTHGSSSQCKPVSVVKSSSRPSKNVVTSSSASDKNRFTDSGSPNSTGKQVSLEVNGSSKSDKPSSNLSRNEDKHEPVTSSVNGRSKSSIPPSKTSHPSGAYLSRDSKHCSLEVKDPLVYRSSKASSLERRPQHSSIGERTGSLQTHGATKGAVTGLQSRGERVAFSNSRSSSKATNPSSTHAPVSSISPAGLSDEELALLLHQELNSSPRVPRVPRVRNTGHLPQLSSASAASMPVKRTSGSGGKELHPFSRRKSKDVRSSQETDNAVRKKHTVPASPDSAKSRDTLNLAEGDDDTATQVQRNVAHGSATASDSVPSSSDANEKQFSKRNSPKNNSEDDTASKGPARRTLPALIAKIMSEGRRMTYEELCNAVLPHWNNLRKHNGERYAYSSHSQAVLDCLRNRSEWARLVDRGPKTNPSRKRRKSDIEPPNTESEDNGCEPKASIREKEAKNLESSREEYPKGKRNARKRRRFSLRGKGGNDARKRRKAEVESDDDSGSFSGSSESESSEDDSKTREGHEASGSSDEAATMF